MRRGESRGKLKMNMPSVLQDEAAPAQHTPAARALLQEGTLTVNIRQALQREQDHVAQTLLQQKLLEVQQEATTRFMQMTSRLNNLGIFDSTTNKARPARPARGTS